MKPNEIHSLYPVLPLPDTVNLPLLLQRSHVDWLNFLAVYNTAVTVRTAYRTGNTVFSLHCLLGFSAKDEENFIAVNRILHSAVAEEFAIIAVTEAGDFILINHDTGWIYFGKKAEVEAAGEEDEIRAGLFYLAGSLSDFIESLKNPPRNRKHKFTDQYQSGAVHAAC